MNKIELITITPEQLNKLVYDAVIKAAKEIAPANTKDDEEQKLLTRNEVCNLLSITLPTLSKYITSGKIKAYRIGNHIRFKQGEVYHALTSIKATK